MMRPLSPRGRRRRRASPAHEAQRERYLQEALALLERVHARGELLPSHLDHRDLRSVRSHPGFQDLRRRAEK